MYTEQTFSFGALTGLSQKQLEIHLKLYAGYVKNTNTLLEKIALYKKDSETYAVELSELTRRFGFEFNGMRLHEHYFEALEGKSPVTTSDSVREAITAQWNGSFLAWEQEFRAIGMMRGIGWVLLVRDEKTQRYQNIWVSDHEIGHLGGTTILLAMDVWEHAFMIDYLPAQRNEYIDAFFQNVFAQG